jgi:hypothetical protein
MLGGFYLVLINENYHVLRLRSVAMYLGVKATLANWQNPERNSASADA